MEPAHAASQAGLCDLLLDNNKSLLPEKKLNFPHLSSNNNFDLLLPSSSSFLILVSFILSVCDRSSDDEDDNHGLLARTPLPQN